MPKVKQKILIVEDEPPLRAVLAQKFRSAGFAVLEARQGEEGLALCFAKKPDGVVLDIVMPRLDGVGFLRQLREDDWGAKVPVVVLTNLSEDDATREAVRGLADVYVTKTNHSLDAVVTLVRTCLVDAAQKEV